MPGERVALLKKSLRGDFANVVFGLEGGKEAYKEALCPPKEDYGR